MRNFRNRRVLFFLLALYLCFWGSSNLSYHTHDFFGYKVSHSHLGGSTSHSHTSSQFVSISLISSENYNISHNVYSAVNFEDCSVVFSGYNLPNLFSIYVENLTLRGPPSIDS